MARNENRIICATKLTSENRITLCKKGVEMLGVQIGDMIIIEMTSDGRLTIRKG